MENPVYNTTDEFCIYTYNGIITNVSSSFLSIFNSTKNDILHKDANSFFKLLRMETTEEGIEDGEKYIFFDHNNRCFQCRLHIDIKGSTRNYRFSSISPILLLPEISALYQLYEDSSTAMAISTVDDFRIICCNKAYKDYSHRTGIHGEVIGQEIHQILKSKSLVNKKFMREFFVHKGRIYKNTRYEKVTTENIVGFWNVVAKPIKVEGRVKYLVITAEDVTESINNEDIIASQKNIISEQQNKLDIIVENMSDCLFIANQERQYTKVNKTARELFGNDSEIKAIGDIINKIPLYKQDGEPLVYEEIPVVKALKGHSIKDVRVSVQHKGFTKYYDINASPIFEKNKQVSKAVMSFRDVSNIILENEKLSREIKCIYDIVNSMDMPLARVSTENLHFIDFNNNCKKLMEGYGINIENLSIREFALKVGLNEVFDYLENTQDYSTTKNFKNLKLCYEGIESYYNILWQPFAEKKEALFIMVDVTEELLNTKKINNLLKAQEEFFSYISHEFKTPITVILSALQVLELTDRESFSPFSKKYLSKIRRVCLKQLRLVSNLLDITRADSGYLKVNRRNLNIVGITKEIVDSIEAYSKEKEIEVIFKADNEEILTAIDDEKYERIILNLLSNAVKFTPNGRKIYVEIHSNEKLINVIVKDEGIGIPKEKLEYLFQRYSQISNSSIRNSEGTGIGLCLAKLMAKALGGDIKVFSELDVGTTFSVSLPLSQVEDESCHRLEEFTDDRLTKNISIEFSDLEIS